MAAALEASLRQLHAILDSIPLLEYQAYRPPIIDGDEPKVDAIPGLRIFKDAVAREIEVLEQFLAKYNGSDFSTNASYFVAVWNEILSAPPPIVAIGKIFDPPGAKSKRSAPRGTKPGGIKVDVVADEGRTWIRVNTMKNSRMLAEFREFDSYLTGSDSGDEGSGNDEPFDPPTDQDNSLLKMGRALVAASTVTVPGTNDRPSVTLRLTRLEPTPVDGATTDPRIAETIAALENMGLSVELGERIFRTLHHDPKSLPSSYSSLTPTTRINADLSMLIALVSDLTHGELPQSEDEAWSRFRMPIDARSWKLGKKQNGEPSDEDLSKHSRALSTQCIQEMEHGLLDEVVGRVSCLERVEFWTTQEARERCLQIVRKIGGSGESRRASALFCDSEDVSRCRELFWRGSRYPASFFPTFLPIRIHPTGASMQKPLTTAPSPFWGHLIQTCQHILSHDVGPHPKLFRKDGEMERAKVTTVNTKLTVHTVESMLVGTSAGMTTLTANRASVKAILREMKVVKLEGRAPLQISSSREDGSIAAIWIVEPRSLAEGMRADHLQTFNSG